MLKVILTVCITWQSNVTVDSTSTTNQCSKYQKKQTAYANENFFSYLGCSCQIGQNLNFVYTPNHNVVSKTTLVCAAVYNASTHSEWLNDKFEPVSIKELLQYKCRQNTVKI